MTSVEGILFAPALFCFALATAGYLLSLLVRRVTLAKISTWILAAGFMLLTLDLLVAAVHWTGWSSFGLSARR